MRAALARVRSVAFKSRTALSREPVTTVTQSVFRSVVREELRQVPSGRARYPRSISGLYAK